MRPNTEWKVSVIFIVEWTGALMSDRCSGAWHAHGNELHSKTEADELEPAGARLKQTNWLESSICQKEVSCFQILIKNYDVIWSFNAIIVQSSWAKL